MSTGTLDTGITPSAATIPPAPGWTRLVGWAALILLIGGEAYGFFGSAPDRDMGHLQKIMYVHVPAAWAALIAYTTVSVAGVLYLWKRDEKYDHLGVAAAEAGVVFNALALALGMIWGRPTWGVWWTWDARLTSTAVLLMIFLGYLSLRSFTDGFERRARWSAVVGIFGILGSFFVYFSVRWWRTLHQIQSSPETVDTSYAWGLRINAIAFLLVFIYFAAQRYRAAKLERFIELRAEERALASNR